MQLSRKSQKFAKLKKKGVLSCWLNSPTRRPYLNIGLPNILKNCVSLDLQHLMNMKMKFIF